MRPRLFSVFFRGSSDQYPRLAAVLKMTARRYCPEWDVDVRSIDAHRLRAASGSQSHADNHHKLAAWNDAVQGAPDGARVLLLDADTFIVDALDPLWDIPFDLAYTTRDSSRFPLNGGVIAVRVSNVTRRFMAAWLAQDAAFLRDARAHRPFRKEFGGINQASLGALLKGDRCGANVVGIPCLEWNCEDTGWSRFGPATRIVHVKSALRMACFGISSDPKVRALARMWRGLDAEASGGIVDFGAGTMVMVHRLSALA